MLAARALTVAYPAGDPVLHGVDLDLTAGRMLAVVGPNGAGKSTLLRALSGELRPRGGAVTLEEKALARWNPRALARRRAVLAQEGTLRFPLSALEVATLGRAPFEESESESHERARRALDAVDMAGREGRLYPTLSGGEQKRVQMARVLAQLGEGEEVAARALLLDEPTSALDLGHRHALLGLARERAREGAAVLAILHTLNLALAYADDALVLREGRAVARGPVRETLTPELVSEVFAVRAVWSRPEDGGAPELSIRPRQRP